MKRVEYRCDRCMIVESKWLRDSVRATEYIACFKCGRESKRISTESIFQSRNVDDHIFNKRIERL